MNPEAASGVADHQCQHDVSTNSALSRPNCRVACEIRLTSRLMTQRSLARSMALFITCGARKARIQPTRGRTRPNQVILDEAGTSGALPLLLALHFCHPASRRAIAGADLVRLCTVPLLVEQYGGEVRVQELGQRSVCPRFLVRTLSEFN